LTQIDCIRNGDLPPSIWAAVQVIGGDLSKEEPEAVRVRPSFFFRSG
jgi:hypothetical protein